MELVGAIKVGAAAIVQFQCATTNVLIMENATTENANATINGLE